MSDAWCPRGFHVATIKNIVLETENEDIILPKSFIDITLKKRQALSLHNSIMCQDGMDKQNFLFYIFIFNGV